MSDPYGSPYPTTPNNNLGDLSNVTDTDDSAWGAMGGQPGDGIPQQPPPVVVAQPPVGTYYTPAGVVPPASTYYTPQQQPSYAAPPPVISGGITRFATPAMSTPGGGTPQQQQQPQQPSYAAGSYAARSTQAYGTGGMQQQQQQPGSYAARSAQAAAVQPSVYGSQQQYSGASTTPTGYPGSGVVAASTAGSSYAQSYTPQQQQQSYSPPQQQQQQSYSAQQQQPQQQQQYGASSSYAARSAQAHTPNVMPTPQPSGNTMAAGAPSYPQDAASYASNPSTLTAPTTATGAAAFQPHHMAGPGTPNAVALQQRLLTDATRKVQEHAYYMKQAMEQRNLPVVLDRAAQMVGELGATPHHHSSSSTTGNNTGASAKLTPKNYYELYMRALEDLPVLEDYLVNLASTGNLAGGSGVGGDLITIIDAAVPQRAPFTAEELYDSVQYCPRVLPRLYLQITAGSALIRSKGKDDRAVTARFVLKDLIQAVKCEQNPVRGLFLRHYLLTALRDKLPDSPAPLPAAAAVPSATEGGTAAAAVPSATEGGGGEDIAKQPENNTDQQQQPATVQDSYEFVLANFMEMNKLWVRIQHLPGDGQNKDVRKRRERERNELRILVGTNLVRLSQLEHVTSKIYGEVILNQILEHIVTTGDPLSQAYLMDCLVQAFPDEYHIETLPILLNVCPRLRDKVNIRTILQGLMDRLANYLADEELLNDESDTNQVKKQLARDSFGMFEDCVQKVYNARGPKLTSREVIRLQTALLNFSVRCYPDDHHQVARCLGSCVDALRQANASYEIEEGTVVSVPHDRIFIKALDEVAVAELEKLLSIPLKKLALECLRLEHYSDLVGFLPWANRRQVAISMLNSVDSIGAPPASVEELEELFRVVEPMVRDETTRSHAPAAASTYSDDNMTQTTTNLMANLGVVSHSDSMGISTSLDPERLKQVELENSLVCKLVHLIGHDDTDVVYELLVVARKHISQGESHRIRETMVALVYAAVRLVRRLFDQEHGGGGVEQAGKTKDVEENGTNENETKEATDEKVAGEEDTPAVDAQPGEGSDEAAANVASGPAESQDIDQTSPEEAKDDSPKEVLSSPHPAQPKLVNCRKVFIFIQETIASLAKTSVEIAIKLYLEISLVGDSFATRVVDDNTEYAAISFELISQAFSLYEESVIESKMQQRCIEVIAGTLTASKSLTSQEYEGLVIKTAQFAAKLLKKPDQCRLVALCAYLFYPVGEGQQGARYSNPQRALECLQRALKLADGCTSANPTHVRLFVDLLDHYVFFFEKGNPAITHAYITGLVALIKEHIGSRDGIGDQGVAEAKAHFVETVKYIRSRKRDSKTAELFGPIQIDHVGGT